MAIKQRDIKQERDEPRIASRHEQLSDPVRIGRKDETRSYRPKADPSSKAPWGPDGPAGPRKPDNGTDNEQSKQR